MQKTVWLLVLALSGCDDGQDQSPPSSPPTMSPERHCDVAREQAKQGDCLNAGEHLAFCSGPGSAAARAEARALCSPRDAAPSASSTGSIVVPPVVTGTTEPDVAPTVAPTGTTSASASGGTQACSEAIAAALGQRCAAARSALGRCSGPKRATAQAHVASRCQRGVSDDLVY